jgi:hypothetical protein
LASVLVTFHLVAQDGTDNGTGDSSDRGCGNFLLVCHSILRHASVGAKGKQEGEAGKLSFHLYVLH